MGKGYDYQHKVTRARLLPKAWGTPCPLCGQVMVKGQALDLDHALPIALGGANAKPNTMRITHATCNRRAGVRVREYLRRARNRHSSQDW